MRAKSGATVAVGFALIWVAGCTDGGQRVATPTTTPSVAVTSAAPLPRTSVRPSRPPGPRIQHTLDVASRANGAVAVLGQTCLIDSSCTTWVRWSTDAGRTFPRSSQQTVRADLPPRNGEPEGSGLNRIRLGPNHTAWVWASGQPGESAPDLVFWTADDGGIWNSSGEVGYRDVAPFGDSAWVLGGVCNDPPHPGCFTHLTVATAGTDPYESDTQRSLPAESARAFELRRLSATEAFLLTGTNQADPPDPRQLWHTHDGAHSWQTVRMPSACTGAIQIALAAVSPGVAWIDCQGEATMTAPATLWRTADAGGTWRQLPEPPTFRYAVDLVLLSASHALITSGGRADVSETLDRGRSWRKVLPYQEVGNGPIEPGPGAALFCVNYQDEQATGVTSTLSRAEGPDQRWTKITLGP